MCRSVSSSWSREWMWCSSSDRQAVCCSISSWAFSTPSAVPTTTTAIRPDDSSPWPCRSPSSSCDGVSAPSPSCCSSSSGPLSSGADGRLRRGSRGEGLAKSMRITPDLSWISRMVRPSLPMSHPICSGSIGMCTRSSSSWLRASRTPSWDVPVIETRPSSSMWIRSTPCTPCACFTRNPFWPMSRPRRSGGTWKDSTNWPRDGSMVRMEVRAPRGPAPSFFCFSIS
mmetsp:Transcript_16112/g.27802  ORF Transcript_16112/g.27802 Transcript_16112/m.27802 type:complete len:227 (+) Transcript_16112:1206-1886(+)